MIRCLSEVWKLGNIFSDMASRDIITGASAQIIDPGSGQGPRADLLLDMTSLRGAEAAMTSPENGDIIPMSPVNSVETVSRLIDHMRKFPLGH